MSKTYINVLWVLLALVLLGGGYYLLRINNLKAPIEQVPLSQEVVPAIDTGVVNPMESTQSTNPYDQTNPFENVKVNPFQ